LAKTLFETNPNESTAINSAVSVFIINSPLSKKLVIEIVNAAFCTTLKTVLLQIVL